MNRLRTASSICLLVTALSGAAALIGCYRGAPKYYRGQMEDGSQFTGSALCDNSSGKIHVTAYRLQWGKDPDVVEAIASHRAGDRDNNDVADIEYATVDCKEGTIEIVWPHWGETSPNVSGPCQVDPTAIRQIAENLALQICRDSEEQKHSFK